MKVYETAEIAEIRREYYININEITDKIIGCAIEVHKKPDPGFLESVYQTALAFELIKTQRTQRSLRLKTIIKIFLGKLKNFDIILNYIGR